MSSHKDEVPSHGLFSYQWVVGLRGTPDGKRIVLAGRWSGNPYLAFMDQTVDEPSVGKYLAIQLTIIILRSHSDVCTVPKLAGLAFFPGSTAYGNMQRLSTLIDEASATKVRQR